MDLKNVDRRASECLEELYSETRIVKDGDDTRDLPRIAVQLYNQYRDKGITLNEVLEVMHNAYIRLREKEETTNMLVEINRVQGDTLADRTDHFVRGYLRNCMKIYNRYGKEIPASFDDTDEKNIYQVKYANATVGDSVTYQPVDPTELLYDEEEILTIMQYIDKSQAGVDLLYMFINNRAYAQLLVDKIKDESNKMLAWEQRGHLSDKRGYDIPRPPIKPNLVGNWDEGLGVTRDSRPSAVRAAHSLGVFGYNGLTYIMSYFLEIINKYPEEVLALYKRYKEST